jgi:hypothetical protein
MKNFNFFAIMISLLMISSYSLAQVGINDDNSVPDPSAMLDVKSVNKGFLPPRMTTEQRDLISSPAIGLTIFNITNNRNETYSGSNWVGITHYVGESYGGGIVFYVYDGGQHGLIAATTDQNSGIHWYNEIFKYTGTTGDGLNAGDMNTAIIIASQMADYQYGNFAAKVCADYSATMNGNIYGDWYLPSKFELSLLYLQKTVVGGFSNDFYWSSTEHFSNNAWAQSFLDGYQGSGGKDISSCVRAIRAF